MGWFSGSAAKVNRITQSLLEAHGGNVNDLIDKLHLLSQVKDIAKHLGQLTELKNSTAVEILPDSTLPPHIKRILIHLNEKITDFEKAAITFQEAHSTFAENSKVRKTVIRAHSTTFEGLRDQLSMGRFKRSDRTPGSSLVDRAERASSSIYNLKLTNRQEMQNLKAQTQKINDKQIEITTTLETLKILMQSATNDR